jgi:hypothetical protein
MRTFLLFQNLTRDFQNSEKIRKLPKTSENSEKFMSGRQNLDTAGSDQHSKFLKNS